VSAEPNFLSREKITEKENLMDDDNRAFAPRPTCGDDDIDSLVWDDPDGWNGFLLCLACGTLYNPMTGEERRPS
jgi:hypothetical protein